MDGSDLTVAGGKGIIALREVIRLRKLLHDHAGYTKEEVRDRVSPQLIESQRQALRPHVEKIQGHSIDQTKLNLEIVESIDKFDFGKVKKEHILGQKVRGFLPQDMCERLTAKFHSSPNYC